MAQRGHDHRHEHAPHVVPLPVYLGVFAALMVGTVLTVWAARMDFGWLNTPVALAIACSKAALVILYFMHVKYSPRLVGMVVVVSIVFLAILFLITLSDYWTRGGLGAPGT